jgi:hypothetical protein
MIPVWIMEAARCCFRPTRPANVAAGGKRKREITEMYKLHFLFLALLIGAAYEILNHLNP